MKPEVVVGVDVGTSSLKATAINVKTGAVACNLRYEYPKTKALIGVVPARVYEETLIKMLDTLTAEFTLLSVALSSQMYSLCEETAEGVVVYQWNSLWPRDVRAEEWLKGYMERSGCPVDTLYPAYKLATVKDKAERKFVPYGVKEYLIKFLSGELVTDYTTASASGLLDIYEKRWNEGLIKALGYSSEAMPQVRSHNTSIGEVKIPLSCRDGQDIALAPGLGDGISASYTCRGLTQICANVGTSLAARAFVGSPVPGCEELWTYVVDEERYVLGGISSNGCSVLNWARKWGFKLEEAELGESKKGDLFFFPWLHGERTPFWSSHLKGVCIGFQIDTNWQAFAGAIVKGVGFTLSNLIELVGANLPRHDLVAIAGGGVYLEKLMEVIAGSIPMRIAILQDVEYLASYGAALSAAEAIGISVPAEVKVDRLIEPTFQYRKEYEKWLQIGQEFAGLLEKNACKTYS